MSGLYRSPAFLALGRTILLVLLWGVVWDATDVAAQPPLIAVPTPAFGGRVAAVRRDGNTIYLAGSFLGASPVQHALGGLSIHDNTSLRSVQTPYVRGNVNTVLSDDAGGYYLGGDFHAVGSAIRFGLARILADGSLDPTFAAAPLEVPGLFGRVFALARSGGTLFVGGSFRTPFGQERSGLAALDATTGATLPRVFDLQNALGSPSGPVSNLAVVGSTLYVSGLFRAVAGQLRNGLAAFDTSTGVLSAWDPNIGPVADLTIVGGTMYAGTAGTGLYAIDLASGRARPFGPGFVSGDIRSLGAVGGALVIGGFFTHVGTTLRTNLAALDLATGALLPWAPSISETVGTISVAGNTVYIGGGFALVNNIPRAGVAAFDWAAGGSLLPWNPSMNGLVSAIVLDGPRVVLGGEFTAPYAEVRRSVAAIDWNTGLLTPWQADIRGPVDALAISAGRIFLGGDGHEHFGDRGAFLVARDLATGAALPWSAHPNGPVKTIEAVGNTIYASGLFTEVFTQAGTQFRRRLAAFDVLGTLRPFVADLEFAGATALAAIDTRLFVGGGFFTVNGIPRQGFAVVDQITGAVGPLQLSVLGGLHAFAIDGVTLYAALTYLTSPTGDYRQWLAALDTATNGVTAWDPGAAWPMLGLPTLIDAHGGQVFIAGPLPLPPGIPGGYVATVAATGAVTAAAGFHGGRIDALLFDDQVLAVGGTFGFVESVLSPGFALFRDPVPLGERHTYSLR